MALVLGSEPERELRTRRIAVHEAGHAAHAHHYEPDIVEIDELHVSPLQPHCSGCRLLVDDMDAYDDPALATDHAVRALMGDYAVGRLVDGDERIAPVEALAYAAGLRENPPSEGELNWPADAGDVRNAAEALRTAVASGVYSTFEEAYSAVVELLVDRFAVLEKSICALADAAIRRQTMTGLEVRAVLEGALGGGGIPDGNAGPVQLAFRADGVR